MAVAVIIGGICGIQCYPVTTKSLIGDVSKLSFQVMRIWNGNIIVNDVAEKAAEIVYQKVGFNKDQAAGFG